MYRQVNVPWSIYDIPLMKKLARFVLTHTCLSIIPIIQNPKAYGNGKNKFSSSVCGNKLLAILHVFIFYSVFIKFEDTFIMV